GPRSTISESVWVLPSVSVAVKSGAMSPERSWLMGPRGAKTRLGRRGGAAPFVARAAGRRLALYSPDGSRPPRRPCFLRPQRGRLRQGAQAGGGGRRRGGA